MHSNHALKLLLPPCAFLPACACPLARLQAVRLCVELKERGEDGADVHSALVEAFCRQASQQAGAPQLLLPLPLSCCLAARPRLASEPPPALPLARAISASYLLC